LGHNNSYDKTEYIKKQREAKLGERNPNWKGGNHVKKASGLSYNDPKRAEHLIPFRFKKGHEGIKGEKNYGWKGGITPIGHKIRNSLKYNQWRKAVFERDNYTCLVCGKVGGELNAHHIKSFKHYPELRFEVDNGITMCIKCHYLNHGEKESEYHGNRRWIIPLAASSR
jgi:hypothetical protein